LVRTGIHGRQSAVTATRAFLILPEALFRREPGPS
jgi:hypothetical protein